MAVVSRTGCGGHLCTPNQACNVPAGLSPGRYRVPIPLPVLAPPNVLPHVAPHLLGCCWWPSHDGGPLTPPVPTSPHFLLSVIICSGGPRGFFGLFFTELVPTPSEQPGRRVHPTFEMLMKVFQKVNGGQRPGD